MHTYNFIKSSIKELWHFIKNTVVALGTLFVACLYILFIPLAFLVDILEVIGFIFKLIGKIFKGKDVKRDN